MREKECVRESVCERERVRVREKERDREREREGGGREGPIQLPQGQN